MELIKPGDQWRFFRGITAPSTPVPLILNNLFLDSYDDYINPTRCSAVFIGNVVIGGDRTDHGVVLRDKCNPVLINNVIFDCSSVGIAVQNQCDALLVNNTIFNCGRSIRFFDHTGRWGPPYCLTPGSGKSGSASAFDTPNQALAWAKCASILPTLLVPLRDVHPAG